MKNTIITGLILLFFILSGCKDITTKTMNNEEAQTLLTEAVTAYKIYSTTQEDAAIESLKLEKSGTITTAVYPQITMEPADLTTWPKTITVDYGPENFTGTDNHNRRGVMIIDAENFPSVDNTTWKITFDEYYFDDNKVEGTQTVTYMGANGDGHPEYQCTLTGGVITTPEEKVFNFEQQTTREWVSGYDTHEDLCDDDYRITGTHSGVSSDGYTYTMSTTEPLLVNACCRWVEEGKLKVELDDSLLNCEIDYHPATDMGDDLCNGQVAFTIFGVSIPILLP